MTDRPSFINITLVTGRKRQTGIRGGLHFFENFERGSYCLLMFSGFINKLKVKLERCIICNISKLSYLHVVNFWVVLKFVQDFLLEHTPRTYCLNKKEKKFSVLVTISFEIGIICCKLYEPKC